jgi:CUB/sushi domain-containing protein
MSFLSILLIFNISGSCTDPGSPLHGRMTGNIFTHDNYVDYVCDDGYNLSGSKRIQCKDGNWSQSNPRCQSGKLPVPV